MTRGGSRLALAALFLLSSSHAAAQLDPGRPESITAKLDRHLDLSGYFRARFDVMDNYDLNHGPTPSTGQPLFPVPTSGEGALTSGNIRLRLEPTIKIGWGVAIHTRIDLLDNVVMGSTPEGLPASVQAPISGGSTMMVPPRAGENAEVDSIQVKRAWGDVALPFGVLSVGRMGSLIDWGTGFFINSGSCIDCDRGDVGDRISFVTPLFEHILGFAFDFGASGPTSATLRPDDPHSYDLDRRDDVRSYALLFARWDTPEVIERYRRAGRTVFQYGLVASIRTQEYDVPAYYLYGDLDREYDEDDQVRRGLLAFASDVWFGLRRGGFTLDVEGALVVSRVENASLLPGTVIRDDITSRAWGGVARAGYRWPRVDLRLELGLASGDSAPGFGVRSPLYQTESRPGDLDGPQIRLPGDTTVNNFRFNPDYHIDLILWRRIIGTVTDAFYARPSVAWRLLKGLWLESALISSTALEAASTPSGERPLGVELDIGARYQLEPGFRAHLTYGVLFPLSGFRNTRFDLDPEPAHALHVILAYLVP
jgi:uncharacterized protein (TIGR04551 family)